MDLTSELNLGHVQETLLLPLWGRAVEAKKKKPLLVDQTAVSIINSINYDFTTIARNISKMSQVSWIARSIYFDEKIRSFIARYPDATIVNIGCGLDTTFDRIDNGQIHWIDLDLPDVIDLRRNYIKETERRQFISSSVFDHEWLKNINNAEHLMFMFAGVLYYLKEENLRELFARFSKEIPGVEIIFDYSSNTGVAVANRMVIKRGGMDESAKLVWGIDNIHELENWDSRIKILDSMPMYRDHKKHYPFYKSFGIRICDMIHLMSLAHIRIG